MLHRGGTAREVVVVYFFQKSRGGSMEEGELVVVVVGKGQLADKSHYCRLDGDTHTTPRQQLTN